MNFDVFCIYDEIHEFVESNYNALFGNEQILKVTEEAKTQSMYQKIWGDNNYSEKNKNIIVFSFLYLLLFLTEST